MWLKTEVRAQSTGSRLAAQAGNKRAHAATNLTPVSQGPKASPGSPRDARGGQHGSRRPGRAGWTVATEPRIAV